MQRTIIKLAPPSSSPHSAAMCRIPAGSGFGGWKERVIIGEKVCVGRKVFRRWVTGRLEGVSVYVCMLDRGEGEGRKKS